MNNTIKKVTSRKTLKVVANFYNGFAQNVLELEDGTMLFISYGGEEIEIVETEKLNSPAELTSFINSLPEDN